MAISVSNPAQAQAAAQPPAARQTAPAAKQQPAVPQRVSTDTVKISAAAQALQEATESSAQTAKEASSGDVQARSLLARESAARTNR